MAQLSSCRIQKLVETCSIADGIELSYEQHCVEQEQVISRKTFLYTMLDNYAQLLTASRRLAAQKVQLYHDLKRGNDVVHMIIHFACERWNTSQNEYRKALKSMKIHELTLRVHTLCRAVGSADLSKLCISCRDSVDALNTEDE